MDYSPWSTNVEDIFEFKDFQKSSSTRKRTESGYYSASPKSVEFPWSDIRPSENFLSPSSLRDSSEQEFSPSSRFSFPDNPELSVFFSENKQFLDALSPAEEELFARQIEMLAEKIAETAMAYPKLSGWTTEQKEKAYTAMRGNFEGILGPFMQPTPGDTVVTRPDASQRRKMRKFREKKLKSGSAPGCGFCRQKAAWGAAKQGREFREDEPGFWKSHELHDDFGDVVCPYLFAFTCPECGATGKKAHTPRYCPAKKERYFAQFDKATC